MAAHHTEAAAYADRIEAELRSIGAWRDQPPPEEAFQSNAPFFGDTMSYYQWLQFVLLERVRKAVEVEGRFPARSQVGAYAVRELDGMPEAAGLTRILIEFDAFIESL